MPASRQACPVGLWLATSTSIWRRIATLCSALCFFRAMLHPPLVPVSLTFPLVQNSPVRSLGIAGELLGAVRTSQLSGQLIANIEERAGKAERRAAEADE